MSTGKIKILLAIITCFYILLGQCMLCLAVESNSAGKLIFAGKQLGYGDRSAFLRLNRGNPLALAAAKCASEKKAAADEFVICPSEDIVIALEHGKLRIARGTIAYVIDSGSMVAVCDLHDQSANSLVYQEGDKRCALTPGRFLLIRLIGSRAQQNTPEQLKAMPTRNVHKCYSDSNHRVLAGEFSIVAAIAQLDQLANLRHSTDEYDRKLAIKILKTATVCQIVTSGHGQFAASLGSLAD